MMYTASSDGKLCFTDLESGMPAEVLDLNPDGWAVRCFCNLAPIHIAKHHLQPDFHNTFLLAV
jgi:hypothetical protein